MKTNLRLLGVWNPLGVYVLALFTMLSVVLEWSGIVQVTLMISMLVAVTKPLVVPPRARRRR